MNAERLKKEIALQKEQEIAANNRLHEKKREEDKIKYDRKKKFTFNTEENLAENNNKKRKVKNRKRRKSTTKPNQRTLGSSREQSRASIKKSRIYDKIDSFQKDIMHVENLILKEEYKLINDNVKRKLSQKSIRKIKNRINDHQKHINGLNKKIAFLETQLP